VLERRSLEPPLRDYAAIGDGRTVALVSRSGSIDWLCLPDLDSPSVFAALLDRERGGCFVLAPEVPFDVQRRYLPDTNVLETTFATPTGVVRVTDAMTTAGGGLAPAREIVRRVEQLAGEVPMRWRLEPRFGYAQRAPRFETRAGVPVVTSGADAMAILPWAAGEPRCDEGGIEGRFVAREGCHSVIVVTAATGEPLVLAGPHEALERLEATASAWRRWTSERRYQGPWRDAVLRSALALKLLVHAPSGAVAAAATSSLPEEISGERNWDYRYCWIRDSAFALDAFLRLGCHAEADAFFWWLMHATQLTHPRLQVLYRLNGGTSVEERELLLAGYRGSRPVRVGNAAAKQLQLDVYGELLQTAWLYFRAARGLDRDIGRRLAGIADLVARIWRAKDAGIWEVRRELRHFTQSKMSCWIALDRACALAQAGALPGGRLRRWRRERDAIAAFIGESCWLERRGSYTRFAGGDEPDASLLLAVLGGYGGSDRRRLERTVAAVVRELSDGPYVRRYVGDDGLGGEEGALLACSFWLVEALARLGRRDEAAARMDALVALSNDVGLYAEEIDPRTGDFLGNLPQALTHLALISAAAALAAEETSQ
jgi:GH15 family glucan-1,4-alpha-glucosidase